MGSKRIAKDNEKNLKSRNKICKNNGVRVKTASAFKNKCQTQQAEM